MIGFLAAGKKRVASEHLHFVVIRSLAENNDFNAIRYLYDRLNIVDAKAQGLMTRNGLLLTVVSIIGSIKLRNDPGAVSFLSERWEQGCFVLGFILLVASTLLTFPLVLLTFDNITAVPAEAQDRLEKACACHLAGVPPANTCAIGLACRLFQVHQLQRTVTAGRSMMAYVGTFIDITLRRQFLLRIAQWSTFSASLLFFALIGYVFWNAMDQLHRPPPPPAAVIAPQTPALPLVPPAAPAAAPAAPTAPPPPPAGATAP